MIVPASPSASDALGRTAFVGIDWGTTHRRVIALDAQGQLRHAFDDAEGMLRASGRFASVLERTLERVGPLASRASAVLSGMVGSAQGWHEVPYLDTAVPLDRLADHLHRVPDAMPGVDCRIVPGYRWRGRDGSVDVMRGEETQLLGAVALGRRDGWFVLPGTHSKWVRLRDGRIERFATYMTGELFALLREHGTLAPLMHEAVDDAAAFERGVVQGGSTALARALFGCRAQVVAGDLPKASARDHLSGLLIGAEWHDAWRRMADDPAPPCLIGTAELCRRHLHAARMLGVPATALDANDVQLAAWSAFRRSGPRSEIGGGS